MRRTILMCLQFDLQCANTLSTSTVPQNEIYKDIEINCNNIADVVNISA